MTRLQKIKLGLVVIAIIAILLYIIFDPEGLDTVFAFIFLGFPPLVAWANWNSPADRSRNTIDWEMEQERRKKEESDEAIRQEHHNSD